MLAGLDSASMIGPSAVKCTHKHRGVLLPMVDASTHLELSRSVRLCVSKSTS